MAKRAALSKADLLKPKTKQIEVDDGLLTIRALSADYVLSLRGRDLQGTDVYAVIADSIVDEQGVPMLTAEEVGKIPFSILENQIAKCIFEFNALGEKAVSEAVEELKKTDVSITNLSAS